MTTSQFKIVPPEYLKLQLDLTKAVEKIIFDHLEHQDEEGSFEEAVSAAALASVRTLMAALGADY